MTIHRDWFPENDSVYQYITSIATTFFGDDWKSKDSNIDIYRSYCNTLILGQKWDGGISKHLEIIRDKFGQYSIYCKTNCELQDPHENIPALTEFRKDGSLKRQEHYWNSQQVNPPDGTPHKTEYNSKGKFVRGWYANEHGVPSIMVDAKTMAGRRKNKLAELCNNAISGDIVALSGGSGTVSICNITHKTHADLPLK